MRTGPGSRIGPYEVLAPLGAGGMGEVWRARDPRLGRDVAIKTLPEELSRDPELLARLKREARLLASLRHPGINTIYGLEEIDGQRYLVLECVEGPTLAERLEQGPLPLMEALEACRQIAAAIEAAHESGVIHRDLKPANVKLGQGGEVKVLDFGIGKTALPQGLAGEATQSRTLTLEATGPGAIVGTAPYMSPEQALGQVVDRRTDIWSFGCMLYECLSGRQTFGAEGFSATVARVLEREPEWSALPEGTPARVRALLRQCLVKNPKERLRDMGDARLELERVIRGGDEADGEVGAPAGPNPTSAARLPKSAVSRPARRLLLRLGAIAAFALIALALVWGVASLRRPKHVSPQPRADLVSLAVLPLRNLSGDPSQDYLVDGMTESLIAALARTPGLLVLDRNSVSGYKGTPVDPAKVRRELGAQYLLDGSLQHTGDRLRVTARLVETGTSRALWTDQVERGTNDLFSLQDEIAGRVTTALRPVLPQPANTSETERRSSGPPTRSPEAYDLFLRADYLSRKDTRDGRREASDLLLRAVALDPGFAQAHARLGLVAAHQYFIDAPRAEWEQRAFVSIEKALALDPRLAQAYVARAQLVWSLPKGFQHEAALRDLLKAIELEPNSTLAHHRLGMVTLHLGLYERSAAEFRQALRLDPTHNFAGGFLAWIENELGRPEAALQMYERNPRLAFGPDEALLLLGRLDEARRRVEAELAQAPDDGASLARYALVLARAGELAKALPPLRRAAEHLPDVGHIHHVEYDIARAYAILGRKSEALGWLERTARDGMPNHTLFATDPLLTNLRGDPAFEKFLGRLKIQHDYFLALIEGRPAPS